MSSGRADNGTVSLVWGGLGFLGWHVIARLLAAGEPVRVLCRNRSHYPDPPWANDVEWVEIRGQEKLTAFRQAVAGARAIYDFAGASGAAASNRQPIESLEQNCREHLEFLSACEDSGACPTIVFASSWLVYGRSIASPVDEDHPLRPCSVYGAHKACIENYLRIYAERGAIRFVSARLSNPYGFDPNPKRAAYKVLNAFVLQALAGQPITLFGDGGQLRDFLHAGDAADLLVRCAHRPEAANEILNISAGFSHTLRDAVEAVAELVPGTRLEFRPWPREYELVEPGDYRADVAKARRLLGDFKALGLKDGLRSTLSAFEAARNESAVWRAAV
jgi:UDP-glucose 4-epimerase